MASGLEHRIATSYLLMDHFKNYTSRIGPNDVKTALASRELANKIYELCGNSYTSAAALYAPPISYIIYNYKINYTADNKSTHAYIYTNNSSLQSNQLAYIGDCLLGVKVAPVSTMLMFVIEGDKTLSSSSYTVNMTYNTFYNNGSIGATYTCNFRGLPHLYEYDYKVQNVSGPEGTYIISATKSTKDNLDTLTLVAKNTSPEENVKIIYASDKYDSSVSANKTLTWHPIPATAWYTNGTALPNLPTGYLYVDQNDKTINTAAQGVQPPLIKGAYIDVSYPNTIRLTIRTDEFNDKELFNRVTSVNDASHAIIFKMAYFNSVVPLSTSFVRSHNDGAQYIEQCTIKQTVVNYDSSIITRSSNVWLVRKPTSMTILPNVDKNIILYYDCVNKFNIQFTPYDFYGDHISGSIIKNNTTIDKLTVGAVNVTSNSKSTTDVDIYCTPTEVGNVIISASLLSNTNASIISTSASAVVKYSNYDKLNLIMSDFDPNESVITGHNGTQWTYSNPTLTMELPNSFDSNLLFNMKITYDYIVNDDIYKDVTDYFDFVYSKVAPKMFNVTMSYNDGRKTADSIFDDIYSNSSSNSMNLQFNANYGIRIKSIEFLNNDVQLSTDGSIPIILQYNETDPNKIQYSYFTLCIKALYSYTSIGSDEYITGVDIQLNLT